MNRVVPIFVFIVLVGALLGAAITYAAVRNDPRLPNDWKTTAKIGLAGAIIGAGLAFLGTLLLWAQINLN